VILCVSPKPALDISTEVGEVAPQRKLRCTAFRRDPGGGGINVARVVHRLGGDATVVWSRSDDFGAVLQRLIEQEGIRHMPVASGGGNALAVAVREESTGDEYRFTLPADPVADGAAGDLLDAAGGKSPDLVVGSGGLPEGVGEDFYARLGERFPAEIPFLVDTYGPALVAALEGGHPPALVSPNRRELAWAIDADPADLGSPEAAADAALEARRRYPQTVFAVSLGAQGAVGVGDRDPVLCEPPGVEPDSRIGAGDSMMAAMALSLAERAGVEEALRRGVAAGTAAVLTPGTTLCEPAEVDRMASRVTCRRIGP
jgi:6-phosphofructokinase 2